MINNMHVIFLFSTRKIYIFQQLVAFTFQLSNNVKSFKNNIKKRIVNDDIFTKN